jgi:N-acetylmuramoyl-L-alanine amidase
MNVSSIRAETVGVVVHCAATRRNKPFSLNDLRQAHLARGFADIGYHFYITRDGVLHSGRLLGLVGAHTFGHNSNTVAVCLEGGLDENGQPEENAMEPEQLETLETVLLALIVVYPSIEWVKGHRDFSPDLNHDGKITADEWMKQCPTMDVAAFCKARGIDEAIRKS